MINKHLLPRFIKLYDALTSKYLTKGLVKEQQYYKAGVLSTVGFICIMFFIDFIVGDYTSILQEIPFKDIIDHLKSKSEDIPPNENEDKQ